jgi:lipopolysaccharide/colanic/teichoic acid biosynthesis glycosyltransferase
MYKRLKRLTDILLAALLGLIFAPVLACIGTVILLESGRPIFFRQTRIGLYGRPFSIVKFRTLYVGAGKISHPLDQVTPFGRLLRRWGLDEIPQLWNVLKGEMSLVGPRPTLPFKSWLPIPIGCATAAAMAPGNACPASRFGRPSIAGAMVLRQVISRLTQLGSQSLGSLP